MGGICCLLMFIDAWTDSLIYTICLPPIRRDESNHCSIQVNSCLYDSRALKRTLSSSPLSVFPRHLCWARTRRWSLQSGWTQKGHPHSLPQRGRGQITSHTAAHREPTNQLLARTASPAGSILQYNNYIWDILPFFSLSHTHTHTLPCSLHTSIDYLFTKN